MDTRIEQALAQVRKVFAARPKPRQIPHCPMCYGEDEIAHFLSLPVCGLTVEELRPILWNAYTCWGNWPQVAYYVPRLLELYAQEALSGFDDNLFAKLLLAVRPELAGRRNVPDIGETMTSEERQSIFVFVQVVLEARLERESKDDQSWVMAESLSFLAAFDTPLIPFLERLEHHELRVVQAQVAVFRADYVWDKTGFGNEWLDHFSLLPENAAALDVFLAPQAVAVYLMDHIDDVQRFGPETAERVGYGFDRAMKMPSPV